MLTERLNILAVEDEAMIAMELEDMLGKLGHEVVGPAATVEGALRLVQGCALDAAIVDANLGGESARPVVDALRAGGVPVVLASGYEARELSRLGLEGPLVRKPYSAGDLANALQSVRDAPPGRTGVR